MRPDHGVSGAPDRKRVGTVTDREVRALVDTYADAWRRGDQAAVLDCFAPDAVFLPHDGVRPRVGIDELRAFWFPPGASASGIERFDFDLRSVVDHGEWAVAWGTRVLRYWQVEGAERATYEWAGTVLLVLERDRDRCRITHFMNDDPPVRRAVVPIETAAG